MLRDKSNKKKDMKNLFMCALVVAFMVLCCNFRKSAASIINCGQNNDTWVSPWDTTLSNNKELKMAFDVLIKHFQDEKNREWEFQRGFGGEIDSTDYIIKLPVLWES